MHTDIYEQKIKDTKVYMLKRRYQGGGGEARPPKPENRSNDSVGLSHPKRHA